MPAATNQVRMPDFHGAGVLAVFESAERAEAGVCDLRRAGFDTSKLSILGKDEHTDAHQLGLAAAGSRTSFWGRRASLWARLSAALPGGVAMVWVPFVGHVVALGPVASALLGDRGPESAKAAVSALSRMLTLAGMSAGQVRTYEAAVRGGQIVVLVHGAAKEVARARNLVMKDLG